MIQRYHDLQVTGAGTWLTARQMPLNWSTFKKGFVTFEICLLTFSVYIGSAIYTAGTETVVKDFGVSQTKATLGLTLFVAGYGLGPMIWAPSKNSLYSHLRTH